MSNLSHVFCGVSSMERMADAIEELTLEKGAEFDQVKGIANGIVAMAEKVKVIIEDMEAKQAIGKQP